MAANPLPSPLTTDLPTNWTRGQIVAPTGQEVGLPNNYGYNYLMEKVNEARTAINTINTAFGNLPDANTLAQYLKLTGGTMTGNITMSGGAKVTGLPTPTETGDAVPKNYVDQQLSQGLAQYLKLTGGTMTGNITMSGGAKVTGLPTPTATGDAVPKNYVDQQLSQGLAQYLKLTGGTMTGNITMSSGGKVTGLPTPEGNTDAVPKSYVDDTANTILQEAGRVFAGTMVGNGYTSITFTFPFQPKIFFLQNSTSTYNWFIPTIRDHPDTMYLTGGNEIVVDVEWGDNYITISDNDTLRFNVSGEKIWFAAIG